MLLLSMNVKPNDTKLVRILQGFKACMPGVVRERFSMVEKPLVQFFRGIEATSGHQCRLTAYCNFCVMTCASQFQLKQMEFNFLFPFVGLLEYVWG